MNPAFTRSKQLDRYAYKIHFWKGTPMSVHREEARTGRGAKLI